MDNTKVAIIRFIESLHIRPEKRGEVYQAIYTSVKGNIDSFHDLWLNIK